MLKNCLGFSNRNEKNYELTKFDSISKGTPPYMTCNELPKLKYLGPLTVNLDSIKNFFGEQQVFNCYQGSYSFEYVWYIKFKDGSEGSISKPFKNKYEVKYNNSWKVCGNSEKVMGHIILLFL
tara:strand:+ start:131 stop:499 length:369 start_codon:yes stop_codon:yes gene_type:complete